MDNRLEQSRFEKNLLEQENQELKKQLSNDHQIKMKRLQQENRKLKQQLSNSHQMKNQQKVFIQWLEKMIKDMFKKEEYEIGAVYCYVLEKYKEIIGDNNK